MIDMLETEMNGIKRKVIVEVSNLTKTYSGAGTGSGVKALRGISFGLAEGEMLAVMGTSGSGKSTLLSILGALDAPDSGTISLHGVRQDEMSPNRWQRNIEAKI